MPSRPTPARYRDILAGRVAFKLPLRFDPRPLAREIARLPPELWQLKCYHIRGTFSHNATWESLTLRGPKRRRASGKWNILTSGPFVDDDALRSSPGLARTIRTFPGDKTACLLFRLKAGGAVARHTDPVYRYRGRDLVPVHVAVTTNPGARFIVNGQPLSMRAGEVWAINATLPHEVYNTGGTDRVHLLVHMAFDEDVARLFERSRKIKDVPAKSPSAARRYAARYLEVLSRRPQPPAQAKESSRRAARRKAAVVAQFLRLEAAGAR